MAVDTEAALSGNPDQSWIRAGRRRRRQLVVAKGSTSNGTIDAGALVFASRTEALAVLVHPAVVLTCASLGSCCKNNAFQLKFSARYSYRHS